MWKENIIRIFLESFVKPSDYESILLKYIFKRFI